MFDDAQQKQEKQLMAVRNFTQQEVDCIIIAPVIETGWDTSFWSAKVNIWSAYAFSESTLTLRLLDTSFSITFQIPFR